MRAFIKNYIAAEKARREEEGREAGFSLIELIVVVVILGILVAIAIPVFLNIQQTSKDNALEAAASNGAVVVASDIASNVTDVAALNTNLNDSEDSGEYTLTVAITGTAADLENFCVTAAPVAGGGLVGGATATAGPDCAAPTP
jgi:type IV pilus assembly protein PilA